ncbi:hypothetical protein HHI36_018158 [Cryptolaemus montrouzieri]|uniref:Uncharacterized protein n=1 Tax=Cryptolaemus montrouzieri TaxID=559131 RepID=A0ABD2NZJ3_9CUCU
MEEEEVKESNVNHVDMNANINEPTGTNKTERKGNELEKVRRVFEDRDVKSGDYGILRLGSYQLNKNRPIKIILGNWSGVYEVTKKKEEILNGIPALNIFRDQTLKQRTYYKNIQSELRELIVSGDDMKTIRRK